MMTAERMYHYETLERHKPALGLVCFIAVLICIFLGSVYYFG
jgi:hypothetical protein